MTRPRGRTVAILLAYSVALGLLLGFHRWLPDPRVLTVLAPTVESFLLIVLLWITSRSGRKLFAVHVALALVASVLVLFGVGEAFYQAMYRREFVPWTDLTFLPALLNMVFETREFERTLFVVVPVALVIAVVSALIYVLLRAIRGRLAVARRSEALLALAVMLALAAPAAVTGYARGSGGAASGPLVVRALSQLSPPGDDALPAPDRRSPVQAAPRSANRYAFPYLRDRDVHFFIVESYGHTVMSNRDHRDLMLPVYAELSTSLRESGYWSYTGFLSSPAFGGRSWLADATMLTGILLDTQHRYDTIVESGARNLTHILGDAGYHRLLAAPGTYEAGSAWREFYEFDQYLFRYDFGYEGPFVSFGAMPDQFLIHRANELAAPGDAPLFMNYILVSSHVPFDRIPPYVDDWTRLGTDGSIFNELPLITFDNNWLTGGEYPQGYVASIRYTLTSVVEFLRRLDDEALVIIVGDHQPRIPISEPDSTFSVPIHVVSRDLALIDPFRHYGFHRGFTPDARLSARPDSHPPMDRLLEMLLDVARGVTVAYELIEP